MNNIVNDWKGHNIMNDSFADKRDGLLVNTLVWSETRNSRRFINCLVISINFVPDINRRIDKNADDNDYYNKNCEKVYWLSRLKSSASGKVLCSLQR